MRAFFGKSHTMAKSTKLISSTAIAIVPAAPEARKITAKTVKAELAKLVKGAENFAQVQANFVLFVREHARAHAGCSAKFWADNIAPMYIDDVKAKYGKSASTMLLRIKTLFLGEANGFPCLDTLTANHAPAQEYLKSKGVLKTDKRAANGKVSQTKKTVTGKQPTGKVAPVIDPSNVKTFDIKTVARMMSQFAPKSSREDALEYAALILSAFNTDYTKFAKVLDAYAEA